MNRLFAYGTLRDPEFRSELFGREIAAEPATLAGWAIVVAETGYFTIVEDPHGIVAGELLDIDAAALAICDRWEGDGYARREAEAIDASSRPVRCWIYVRATASRETPAAGTTSAHERADVLASIRALRAD